MLENKHAHMVSFLPSGLLTISFRPYRQSFSLFSLFVTKLSKCVWTLKGKTQLRENKCNLNGVEKIVVLNFAHSWTDLSVAIFL